MWIIKPKKQNVPMPEIEEIEFPTEREAYDYCKEMHGTVYYEWISDKAYMERKTKQWNRQSRNALQ